MIDALVAAGMVDSYAVEVNAVPDQGGHGVVGLMTEPQGRDE